MAQAVFNLRLKFSKCLRVTLRNKNRIVAESAITAFLEEHLPFDDAGKRSKQLTLACQDHDTSETCRELLSTKIP